jgi:general L-amino acid transport system permease protein
MASRPDLSAPAGARAPSRPGSVRAWASQGLVLAVLGAGLLWLGLNAAHNMQARDLTSGFAFLGQPAGFDISESLIPFSPQDSNAKVFLVGALNTLLVSAIGIVGATILGFTAGLARVSSHLLVRALATGYVELVRNIPAAIQILLWYSLIYLAPPPRAAWRFAGLVLSNRGLRVPTPVWHGPLGLGLVAALLCVLAGAYVASALAKTRWEQGAGRSPAWGWTGGLAGAFLVLLAIGRPWGLDIPRLKGFEYEGGAGLSPVLVALATGLAVYTGAFIAEIVRGGVISVARGQTEAARALGLPPGLTLRRVILPQALRSIVPPLASQYLNLVKNSSLALIIGYPDLVAVFAGTALNQTGQAIECISLTMAFYIAVSLCIGMLMNGWNRRAGAWGPAA